MIPKIEVGTILVAIHTIDVNPYISIVKDRWYKIIKIHKDDSFTIIDDDKRYRLHNYRINPESKNYLFMRLSDIRMSKINSIIE